MSAECITVMISVWNGQDKVNKGMMRASKIFIHVFMSAKYPKAPTLDVKPLWSPLVNGLPNSSIAAGIPFLRSQVEVLSGHARRGRSIGTLTFRTCANNQSLDS